MDIRRYGQKDIHTEGGRGGGDTFHMSRYDLSHVSDVQCNSTLQYSAVQHCSRLVHQKIQKNYFQKIKLAQYSTYRDQLRSYSKSS